MSKWRKDQFMTTVIHKSKQDRRPLPKTSKPIIKYHTIYCNYSRDSISSIMFRAEGWIAPVVKFRNDGPERQRWMQSQADFLLPLDVSSWQDVPGIISRSCSSFDLSGQLWVSRRAVTKIMWHPTAFTHAHAGRPTHTIDMPVSQGTPSCYHRAGFL